MEPNNSHIIIDVFSEYEISGRPIDNVYVKSSWSLSNFQNYSEVCISNVIMCLTSHWLIIFTQRQLVDRQYTHISLVRSKVKNPNYW
jgi:hypothetical protein